MTNTQQALELVTHGQFIGLGTGRAATAFMHELAARIRAGLRVRCVPTSQTTAAIAKSLNIPLVTLDEAQELDLTVDGADEVDPDLNLIKGYGGALIREKMVAAASRQLVILVGSEKLVSRLGERGILPVEVSPFAAAACQQRLTELGFRPKLRKSGAAPFVSDNGNLILDAHVGPLENPREVEQAILANSGVVGTGFFLQMAEVVFVQDGDQVREMRRAVASEMVGG